jgi:cytochrome c-type biogenesis protein CcmH/NrfG
MMVPEAVSEIRTLIVVAKTYMATQQPAKAVKALDEALALLPPLAYEGTATRFTTANTP